MRFQLRRLHVSPTLQGMVRVDGDLDPETGQVLITALRSVLDAEERRPGADRRIFAQRRADALSEICRSWLDSTDRPLVSGERPHVTITVDLEALEGRSGFRCELGDAGTITPETARRWACDAPSPGSSPLEDLSRSKWAAALPWCLLPCAGRWWSGMAAAGSRGATVRRGGAMLTTSDTGPTEDRPRSPTWCCCAGRITG
jgi:Domain of unknown function (DUF222)